MAYNIGTAASQRRVMRQKFTLTKSKGTRNLLIILVTYIIQNYLYKIEYYVPSYNSNDYIKNTRDYRDLSERRILIFY